MEHEGQLLLSIPDTSRALGISRTHTYELMNGGDLVSVKIGRRRLVRRDSIEAFIERLSTGREAAA